jgi:hypothetical protein
VTCSRHRHTHDAWKHVSQDGGWRRRQRDVQRRIQG